MTCTDGIDIFFLYKIKTGFTVCAPLRHNEERTRPSELIPQRFVLEITHAVEAYITIPGNTLASTIKSQKKIERRITFSAL